MAREMAVQMLYQIDMARSEPPEAFAAFDLDEYLRPAEAEPPEREAAPTPCRSDRQLQEARLAFEQAQGMVNGTLEHLAEIDDRLRAQAENWRLERMPPVDRNILRLALWEMLNESDVPKLVALDEAVELAKRFGAENSGRFVNGLLDALMRGMNLAESPR